jgi:hypothetical protein
MVVETPRYLYVFELKAHIAAEIALKQIEEKMYYERFVLPGLPLEPKGNFLESKKVVLVGLSFTKEKGKATVSCKPKDMSSKTVSS